MATNEKDYNEIWLQAMDTLIQSRLQGLEFDKTVVCQIIKDKGQGVFLVKENDSVQYEASVVNALNASEYKVNDWVYVLIPSSDYARYKVIVSKYTNDNRNKPVAYVPPLGTVVSMTDNIYPNETSSIGSIMANKDTPTDGVSVVELGVIDLEASDSTDVQNNSIYDTLAVTASFKTLFNNTSMTSGSYGLLLHLIEQNGHETPVLLDSSDMFGDPYNFSVYLKQSKSFDISKLGTLKTIRVLLYEDNKFQYYDAHGDISMYPQAKVNNILVKDIMITLGHDIKTIPDDTFKLTVLGNAETAMSYDKAQEKEIQSTWYNKTKDNEFIGFSDGVVDASYDEDSYMKEYEENWAGMTFGEIEGIPLVREAMQIYANTLSIEKKLQLMLDYIDQDISTIINDIQAYLNTNLDAKEDKEFLDNFDTAVVDQLSTYIQNLTRVQIVQTYKEYLSACNEEYENDQDSTIDIQQDSLLCGDSITQWVNYLINTWTQIKNLLRTLVPNITNKNISFTTYIEGQYRRIEILQNKIEALLNEDGGIVYLCKRANNTIHDGQSKDLIQDLTVRFLNGDISSINQEYQEFITNNKNKYCIYWYEKDLAAPGDRWVEAGWKRIPFDKSVPGMPSVEGTSYTKTSSKTYTRTMNPDVAAENIKAILFYNHIKYESNVLEFTNLNPPQDTTQADIADAVYIEHSSNSEGSYQKYNSTYGLVSAVDGLLNRGLKVRYDGFAQGDEGLIGTIAYWYVPNQATMLTYDKVKLTRAGYSDLDDIDEKTTTDPVLQEYLKHKRTGFKCFYKNIRQGVEATETEPAKPLESDTLFYYMIAKVFNPAFSQNTIYCVINKDGFDYEGSINFTFSTFGTSGTDYTVSIVPAGTQYAIEPSDPLELEIGFSYLNGLTVDNSPTPVLSWLGPHYNGLEPSTELRLNSIDFTKCLYNVLKCEVQWNNITEDTPADQTLTLSSVYPVALAAGSYYLEGATTVIYNDLGAQPTYYNKKYKLFERHTNNEEDVTWEIIHYDDKGEPITDAKILQYAPTLQHVEETAIFKEPGYYLKPLNMYMSDLGIYSVVVAKQGNNILLAQPIYVGQHRWGSSLLNSWNESLTIDEKNGTILSTMVGAGYKDTENAFHGVLMGDVATTVDDKTTITPGLYGFHAGAQSFAWKVDGTGFIGKSGRGRIEFDGNNGLIKSASWDGTIDTDGSIKKVGTSGMAISLSSGQIDAHDFKLTSNNIYLNSNPDESNKDYYIKIGENEKFLSLSGNKIFQINVPGFKVNSSPGENESYLNIGNNNNYIKFINQGNGSNKLSIVVDDLIITSGLGGTNLLAGTNQGKINWAYSGETGDRSIADDVDKLGVKLTCTTVSSGWSFAIYKPGANSIKKLMPNTKYSLSFYLKSDVVESGTWVSICKPDGKGTLVEKTIVLNSIPGDNEWHKYSVVFTTNDLAAIQKATDDEITQGIYFYGFNTVGTRIIKDLKLEQGQNATAWSPAPEDTTDAINKLDQQEIFNRLTNGTTDHGIYLTDGHLYINASWIATGVLMSQNWLTSGGDIDDGKIITSGTEGMAISLINGHIDARDFTLNSGSIMIKSSGDPAYLDIKHSYIDSNNVEQATSVFTISADGTFKLQSVPLGDNKTVNYYVIINSDEDSKNGVKGFNHHPGTLNSDGTIVSMDTSVSGVYPYNTPIPVTSIHPYLVKGTTTSFAYQSVDDTWFYCAIGRTLYLKLESHPNMSGPVSSGTSNMSSSTTKPETFIAFSGWVTGDSSNKMSIDLQKGTIDVGSGTQIYLDKEKNQIWTSTNNRNLNIGVTESTTPFTLGALSIGWDGQLTGTLNNKRRWYIKPDGGVSFGWLWSSSISCNSLTVKGTDILSKFNSYTTTGRTDGIEERLSSVATRLNIVENHLGL